MSAQIVDPFLDAIMVANRFQEVKCLLNMSSLFTIDESAD